MKKTSILSMETNVQTPILEDCVRRNPYLELLYIQGKDGMQTGRSSGELACPALPSFSQCIKRMIWLEFLQWI